MELVIKIPDEVYKTVLDGSYCGSLYEELKAAIPLPYEPSEDLIRRSDALKAVDNRHEELLHDTEYLRKHCQIDLLGIKKHILAIPPVNVFKPTKGDLISRAALQAELDDYIDDSLLEISDVKELIDNAQAVELDESVIQEVLNKRGMTAVANEYLVTLHGKRPQDECCDSCYLCDVGNCDVKKAER